MGIIPKISGKYTFGYNVNKEYFDQQIEFINEENSIYDEYYQMFLDEEPIQIRKNLGAFMFTGDDVFKKINVLSGGEKVRLGLCKIMKKNPNLLLLDEPTNHLDIYGKECLESLLTSYTGTVLFVSHDRYFINKVADSLLIFENDRVLYFNGTYNEYLKQKEKVSSIQLNKSKEVSNNLKKDVKLKPKNINSIIKKIEKEIEIKELKKKELEEMMLDESVYMNYKKMNEIKQNLEEITREIEEKYYEWERLNS